MWDYFISGPRFCNGTSPHAMVARHVNNFFAYLLFPRNAHANASAPLSNTRKANRIHCDGLAESLIYFYSRKLPTIFRVMSYNFDGRKTFPYAAHSSVFFFVPCLLFLPSSFSNIIFLPLSFQVVSYIPYSHFFSFPISTLLSRNSSTKLSF